MLSFLAQSSFLAPKNQFQTINILSFPYTATLIRVSLPRLISSTPLQHRSFSLHPLSESFIDSLEQQFVSGDVLRISIHSRSTAPLVRTLAACFSFTFYIRILRLSYHGELLRCFHPRRLRSQLPRHRHERPHLQQSCLHGCSGVSDHAQIVCTAFYQARRRSR